MNLFSSLLFSISILLALSCSRKSESRVNQKNTETKLSPKENSVIPVDLGLDNMVNQLIGFSAKDFLYFEQPQPIGFHNIRLKMMKTDQDDTVYMICGTYLSSDQKNIPFATIKTSDYEQWTGAAAIHYCENAIEIPYSHEKISPSLEQRLQELRQPK